MQPTGKFIAHSEIIINAPVSAVWRALITPELIKQYLFGTDAFSDWKEGSELHFKGEYEGKEYHEKGKITKMDENKIFQYTYLMGGIEDTPDNYMLITNKLEEDGDKTKLILTQENIKTEEVKKHSEENWKQVLQSLKNIVESS